MVIVARDSVAEPVKRDRSDYMRDWARKNRPKRNLYRKRWMAKNPEKHANYAKIYREQHQEACKQALKRSYQKNHAARLAKGADYRRNNPEKIAAGKRAFYFGSCANAYYLARLQEQNGKCAICGMTPKETGRGLGLDHDHKFAAKDPTGWRGLLCQFCNAGLGNFREDLNFLGGPARAYILKWRKS